MIQRKGRNVLKFDELNRTTSNTEARTTYNAGKNLTIHLTSRFTDKVKLEDTLYDIILQQLRINEQSKQKQLVDGHLGSKAV